MTFLCVIFSERLRVNVEVFQWKFCFDQSESCQSGQFCQFRLICMHCRVWLGGGGGLLTHISIMLASISHIWPKFRPIAVKFIKVLTHILPKLHTAAVWQQNISMIEFLKNLFVQSGSK